MTGLRQRILWRSVPAGLAAALVGFLLIYVYVPIARLVFPDMQIEDGGAAGMWRGVALFGLIGFALSAAIECVRRSPPK